MASTETMDDALLWNVPVRGEQVNGLGIAKKERTTKKRGRQQETRGEEKESGKMGGSKGKAASDSQSLAEGRAKAQKKRERPSAYHPINESIPGHRKETLVLLPSSLVQVKGPLLISLVRTLQYAAYYY
jgi:hypothetical protein